MKIHRNAVRCAAIIPLSILYSFSLVGCDNSNSEEALMGRVRDYWEATRLHDYHTIYNMESRVVLKKALPHEFNTSRDFGITLDSYDIENNPIIEGDFAEVKVTPRYTLPDFNGKTFGSSQVVDHWTYIEGAWYHGRPQDVAASKDSPPTQAPDQHSTPTPPPAAP